MAVRLLTHLCILLLFACHDASIVCYKCASTHKEESCLHTPTNKETGTCQKGCSLETVYNASYIVGVSRRCYDGTLLLINPAVFNSLNIQTNRTVFSFSHPKFTLSVSVCEENFCNGPVYNKSPHVHSPTLLGAPAFTILLPHFLSLTGLW